MQAFQLLSFASLDEKNSLSNDIYFNWIMCDMLNCPGDILFTKNSPDKFYFESESYQYTLDHDDAYPDILNIQNSTLAPPSLPMQPGVGTYLAFAVVRLNVLSVSGENAKSVYLQSLKMATTITPADVAWGLDFTSYMMNFSYLILSAVAVVNIYYMKQLFMYRNHSILKNEAHLSYMIFIFFVPLLRIAVTFINAFSDLDYNRVCSNTYFLPFANVIYLIIFLRIWRIYVNENMNADKKHPLVFRLVLFLNINICGGGHNEHISDLQYWCVASLLCVPLIVIGGVLEAKVHVQALLVPNESFSLLKHHCYRGSSVSFPFLTGVGFILFALLMYGLFISKDSRNGEINHLRKCKWWFISIWFLHGTIVLLIRDLEYLVELTSFMYATSIALYSAVTFLPTALYYLKLVWYCDKKRLLEDCRVAPEIYDAIYEKLLSGADIPLSEWLLFRRKVKDMAMMSKAVD